MNKWIPITEGWQLRRLGKLGEECGELSAITSRCIIQGMLGINPKTYEVNKNKLLDELADVQAQIGCTLLAFDLDQDYLARRVAEKIIQMRAWEDHFKGQP